MTVKNKTLYIKISKDHLAVTLNLHQIVVKIIIYSKKLIEDKISSLIKESDREPMSIGKRIKEIEKEVSKNGDYIFSTSGKK